MQAWISMQIKSLTPNAKNPRTISDAKLSMLKKALAEFGDLSGIVFNRKTKQLVGGHQRCKLIDEKTPIVIVKKHSKPTKVGTVAEGYIEVKGERFSYREVYWPEHKEKAANIAANKGAGEWDKEQLAEWMRELSSFDLNFDMDLTMFDSEELLEFEGITVKEHTRTSVTGVDEDEVPEKAPARTQPGDAYILGMHRLLCADSTDETQVARLIGDKKIDMVFTDPPYGISIVGNNKVGGSKSFGKVGGGKIVKANTYANIIGDDTIETAVKAFKLCKGIPVQIFWGGNYYASTLPDSSCWIVWDKQNTGNFADAELAWTNQKTAVRIFQHMWNGMIKASEHGTKRCHPTQKPIALAEWCFESYGKECQAVLDLFGGSGSTLIACEKTNRQCFMMELDPHYCDVIVERWEKYTGQKAKLSPRPKIKRSTPEKQDSEQGGVRG